MPYGIGAANQGRGVSAVHPPTDADLGFVEAAFNAVTDQVAGTHLFTAQILAPEAFVLQGYTFSNFRRTAGFSKLTGGTETATTRPFTSNSMVIGDAGNTTCTISADFTGPTSGTIVAIIPGTIEAPPGTVVLHQFTLHNTGGSTIKPRTRLGVSFEPAAFPTGFEVKVRELGGSDVTFAALAGKNTWTADSSVRSSADGGLVMEDSVDLTAASSRVYEVYATTGTQAVSAFNPWTWIAAHANDFTVAITSRTGSSTGAMSSFTFSLQTAIATTTRREVLCDTDRFVRVKVWQAISAADPHLVCEFHLDFWLDGSDVPVAIEFAPVLTQHWWVADPFGTSQTKQSQTYTCTVKYGTGTTLDTRAAVAHAYYCRWASLRSTDDAQHARKHWIDLGATPLPTVRVQYSDASLKSMMRAGYIPPLRLGVNYSTADGYPSTYVPLGVQGHRAGINVTGAYAARGIWGNIDSKLVSLQGSATAATAVLSWRKSRVMAQAGLSVYLHQRDHRSASGVNGGTDAPNRIIPQTIRQATALSLSQSYTGLGAHCVYSRTGLSSTTGLTVLTHVAPVGGSGTFSSYDNAHAPNYSAPMAFFEAEAYLADAVVSHHNATACMTNFSEFGCDARLLYWGVTARQAAQSIPTSLAASAYGTMPCPVTQERDLAWSINLLREVIGLRADSHPETPFLKNMVKNFNAWLSVSFDYFTTTHRARGPAYPKLQNTQLVISPWMCIWQGMSAYQANRVFDFLPNNARGFTGIEEVAILNGRWVADLVENNPYGTECYRILWAKDAGGLTLVGETELPRTFSVAFSSNTGTATPPFGMVWQNNDRVRLSPTDDNVFAQTALSGLDFTTLYYMVQCSGNTFKLSATQGGSAINIGNGTRVFGITMADYADTPIGPQGVKYWPGDDSYMAITFGALEQAIGEGHPDITPTIRDNGRAFFAPKVASFSDWASWNYDGGNLA